MNFSVIFLSEDTALKFAVHLLRNGQKVSFGPYLLARDSEPLGGQNDGWGCFAQE